MVKYSESAKCSENFPINKNSKNIAQIGDLIEINCH